MIRTERAEYLPFSRSSNQEELYFDVTFNEAEFCPRCGRAISPYFLYAVIHPSKDHFSYTTVVNYCTACNSVFLAHYTCNQSNRKAQNPYLIEPMGSNPDEFDPEIEAISQKFVEIYNQSKAAEDYKLYEIAGTGYRKALEFLIKDYLSTKFPDRAEKIRNMFLGNCINELDFPPLKTVASRAVWLGNDQTHYYQKHNKDINDLKKMINLTIHWISLLIGTENAAAIESK